jgi:antitoxin YefM
MDAISYSAVRANLAKTLDRVVEDRAPVIVTRKGQSAVVILSLDDYRALEETAHLLRSPANAKRLTDAVAQLEAGAGIERTLAP